MSPTFAPTPQSTLQPFLPNCASIWDAYLITRQIDNTFLVRPRAPSTYLVNPGVGPTSANTNEQFCVEVSYFLPNANMQPRVQVRYDNAQCAAAPAAFGPTVNRVNPNMATTPQRTPTVPNCAPDDVANYIFTYSFAVAYNFVNSPRPYNPV